jgi:hypothetical protein
MSAVLKPERIKAHFEASWDGGWYCYDYNTYDGAPDTSWPLNAIGHGPTKHEALADLLEQIDG